jgi:predicted dinucleotide-binding enzyme
MNITVIGRGNVGGGLARRWERAGHAVTALGRDGGDASGADVVLVAVPDGAIAGALGNVTGLEGKTAVDATNAFGGRDGAYESLAHQVRSVVGGPVAKAFNLEYAVLYDRIDEQRVRPSSIYVAEDGARDVAHQLLHDAGYDPVFAGGIDLARALEDSIALFSGIRRAGLGAYFHRYAKAGRALITTGCARRSSVVATPALAWAQTRALDRRRCGTCRARLPLLATCPG